MKKKRPRIKRPMQSEPELLCVNPRTKEDFVVMLNVEGDDSILWKTEKLTVEEIIEKYPLTEEQITKLKDLKEDRQS